MLNETVIFITEILGTVAFSISGALVAIDSKLDVFGVLFVGGVTATGGGIIRDILLGKLPPVIFSNLYILYIALASALVLFMIAYAAKNVFTNMRAKIEHITNIFDALGLAAFSIVGTETACAAGYSDNAVFAVLLGMLTGIGGGILRDILTDSAPFVLRKHVYALASIAGCTVYYIFKLCGINAAAASLIGMTIIFAIRMLATKFRWKMPKVILDEDKK